MQDFGNSRRSVGRLLFWSLNAVAEERLLTDDIKKRFDVESVKLETTILEKDYLACKLFLMDKLSE